MADQSICSERRNYSPLHFHAPLGSAVNQRETLLTVSYPFPYVQFLRISVYLKTAVMRACCIRRMANKERKEQWKLPP